MTARLRFLPWIGTGLAAQGVTLSLTVGASTASVPLQRLGPGDVARIAETLTLLRDPAPQSVGFPASCLASVAFADAGLPWQFTPQAPDAANLLPPWLTLVVVDDDDRSLATRGGGLQVLTVAAARLPAFDELPALAHLQLDAPAATDDVDALLRAGSRRLRSRLLAAQRLAPSRRYVACLVPTYEAGRLAGLGEPVVDASSPAPAWGASGDVTLPVYASWRFGTAAEADLETVVRRVAESAPPALPPPPVLDLSALGVDASTRFRGILRAVAGDPASDAPPAPAVDALRRLLDQGAALGGRRVGLPWLARGAGAGFGVAWADALNVDPRLRAMAGLGARLVRGQQDALVDAFWRRAGDVQRAQRLVVGATLAATVGARLVAKHLAPAGTARVLQALRPLAGDAVRSAAPGAAAPRLFKRPAPGADVDAVPPAALRRIAATRRLVAGAAVPPMLRRDLLAAPRAAADALFAINTMAAPAGSEPAPETVLVARPSAIDVAALAQQALKTVRDDVAARRQLGARVDFGGFVAGAVSGSAAPRGSTRLDDALVPALAAIDARWVLPAVDALPDDSLFALAVDGAAVEALIVGANDELVRELQWRGAPVTPGATLLANAWDALPHPPIADWDAATVLGAHAPHLAATVVVLRSAIVNRLPGFEPWLVQAQAVGGGRRPGSTTLAPAFDGRLGDDIAYFGFAVAIDALAGRDGGAGWYFGFQQGSARPRFGLDESPVEPFARWSDLDWSRVGTGDGRLHLAPAPRPSDAGGLAWGRDGAQMAAILMQKPVRFAIHGSQIPGLASETT